MDLMPTAPPEADAGPVFSSAAPVAWPLSADDPAALRAAATAFRERVLDDPRSRPADVGRDLVRNPPSGGVRAVVLGSSADELVSGLTALAAGEPAPGVVTGRPVGRSAAFVYPGQGSQWLGMASELIRSAPVFAETLRRCSADLESFTGWSVFDLLEAEEPAAPSVGPDVVQPALYAVMIALTDLWRACGTEPAALVGHSLGEVVAAEVSGALSPRDAARVVALWSKAQATLVGKGEMVFAMVSEDEAWKRLEPWRGRLGVAAVNGPNAVIVSGDADAAGELLDALLDDDVFARRADVGLAAHSTHIDEIVPRMRVDLGPIRPREPGLPLYSGLYGRALRGELVGAEHWCRNLRRTVRFRQAVEAALADGHRVLVEVSPHPVLATDVADTARRAGVEAVARETLRRDDGGVRRFLHSVAEVYVAGVPVDWGRVQGAHPAGTTSVPPPA